MSATPPPVCRESDAWGAELALGLASGPERAAGLTHLAGCPSCREQVDELARVADRLLLLAPDAEPPAGFESRVLTAVGSTTVGRGGRRRAVLVAALLVVASVGGGVVADELRAPGGTTSTAVLTGLAVSASGRTSCRVVVSGTRPVSVLVSLDGYPGADMDMRVEMESTTGAKLPLGPVRVTGGHGLLVRTLDIEAHALRLMRMLDHEGRVVYEATLHEPSPS